MKKVAISVAIVISVLLIATLALPLLFKDRIVAEIKKVANEHLLAKVDFGDFDLTIIRSFPDLTLCMNDLSVTGIEQFEGDTLLYAGELSVRLDLMSVIRGGNIRIATVGLNKGLVNLLVQKDGKANWDITKPAPSGVTAPASSFDVSLKSYQLDQCEIRYLDESAGIRVLMKRVMHSGSGNFSEDLFTLSTTSSIERINVWYHGIKYLSEVQAALLADLEMDMQRSKYTFKKNELKLNDLSIGFNGYVAMPDDAVEMDVKFVSGSNDFRSFISLIPAIYHHQFSDLNSSGTLAFNGFVKGIYGETSMPGYGVKLAIKNGMFQYSGLPAAVKNVQVDLDVNNPDGIPDHTIINLRQLHAEIGNDPFDAHLFVSTPVSDAHFNGAAKGKINLDNISKIVPLEKGVSLSGLLLADLTVKGRMSSIERKRFEELTAAGNLSLTDAKYAAPGYTNGISVNRFVLNFNPRHVALSQCDLKIGHSDLRAIGTLDNLPAYYFRDEPLKGTLSIRLNLLDLNELLPSAAPAQQAETASASTTIAAVEIPSHVDFDLAASITKLLYEDLMIQDLEGKVRMHDAMLEMEGLSFNTLGGSVNMNGSYASTQPDQPAITYKLSVKNADIAQSVKAFEMLKSMAPIAERCSGKVSADFTIKGRLDAQMNPVLNTLTGSGALKTGNVLLTNFEPVSKIADALKMPQYKQLALDDVSIFFSFRDGRVAIEPFQANLSGSKATIAGSHGFDQTINYTINLSIPKAQLGTQAMGVMNGLMTGAGKVTGSSYTLPDPVDVKILIGGTVTKPVVKTGLKDAALSIAETVQEEVKAVVEEKIDEEKAEARAQADKLISDAEQQAKVLHDAAVVNAAKLSKEGYAAADNLIAQAKDPISKAAAKVAADKLKKETDAKAAQLIRSADEQGQKLIDEAKRQSEELLK